MSQTIENLAPLFDLSRDAVAGIREGRIVFANPAARTLCGLLPGAETDAWFPDLELSGPEGCLRSTTVLAGREMDLSAVRQADGTLVTLTPRSDPAIRPGADARALGVIGDELMSLRLAIDGLADRIRPEQDPRLARYSGILYRSYYRLKRTQHHMAMEELLRQGEELPEARLLRLDEICRELCATTSLLTRERSVTLTCETPDGYCPVKGDQHLVEIMLLNLLANSLQHTPPGGVLRLTVSRRDRTVLIALDDTGDGIPGDTMAALFDGPGEPTLAGMSSGAGLGLALARRIAEQMGGSLLLESREGEGARLRVRLPLAEAEGCTLAFPAPAYAPDGMETVLTELSVVLDSGLYNARLFD